MCVSSSSRIKFARKLRKKSNVIIGVIFYFSVELNLEKLLAFVAGQDTCDYIELVIEKVLHRNWKRVELK